MKLSKYSDIEYQVGGFSRLHFNKDYNVVVSSLAFHEVEADEKKKQIYTMIYDVLQEEGVSIMQTGFWVK